MKFEERIIELLAEYLRKTDIALEKLTAHDGLFIRHEELFIRNEERFEKHMAAVAEQMTDFKEQMTDFKGQMTDFTGQMTAFKEQMVDFRKAIVKGDVERKVLLEEIFRISKRVQNVESHQSKR